MKTTPRLTVLMPVYNVENYVEEAIQSVLNQTYGDFVLLILDDCSTDKTANIVKSFTDERIRYVKQEKNVGLAENLNTGVELADTEYIARMDGDDISVSTCLEKQIRFLAANPAIDICSVGFQFFGAKTATVFFPERHEDIKANHLFGCNVIVPMLRREMLIKNNLRYKTSAFPAEDYRMWAECLRAGAKMHTLHEILFRYRTHADQISTEKRAAQIEKSNEVRLYVLDWLCPDFTVEEKNAFTEKFIPGKIKTIADIKHMQEFAKAIEKRNKEYGNFSNASLHKRFRKHIIMSTYYSSIDLFFEHGFSLKGYLRFLLSGLFLYVPFKLNLKILGKSLLQRKK